MDQVDAFFRAAKEGDAKGIKALLELGVDVNELDYCGRTAFIYAAISCDFDAGKALWMAGADASVLDQDGLAAIHHVIKCRSEQRAKRFLKQILVKGGSNLNLKDGLRGDTPLIISAKKGYFIFSKFGRPDLAQILIEGGADLNAKNNGGRTALIEASANGGVEIARLLVLAGADLNAADNKGRTALMHSAIVESMNVVEVLINAGADPARQDADCKTAFALLSPKLREHFTSILENRLLQIASKHALLEIPDAPIAPAKKQRPRL